MAKNRIEAPKDTEEFIRSPWFGKAKTSIKRFNLREEQEETMQFFILHCLQRRHFEKYDENKYAFSSYFYGILHNFLCKRHNHESYDNVKRVDCAESLQRRVRGESDVGSARLIDLLEGRADDGSIARQMIQDIMQILSRPQFKAHSRFTNPASGLTYERDMRTVFHMLTLDYSRGEIAEAIGTSESFVNSLFARMRKIPEVAKIIGRLKEDADSEGAEA